MIIGIIPLIISIILSVVSISSTVFNIKKIYASSNFIIFTFTYLFYGVFFFLFFYLSTEIMIDSEQALLFWKISIIMRMVTISLNFIIYNLTLDSNKINRGAIFFLCFIAGIIISLLSFHDSIGITQNGGFYIFLFLNPFLLLFLIIFDILVVVFIIFIHVKNRSKISYDKLEYFFIMSIFLLTFIIFTYTIYMVTQNFIFADISNLIYIFSTIINLYVIIKNPYVFIAISNEIHEFIIFHKSGILLYSYNFETGEETDDSILKGSILIGINHILSNFIDKKDQLNLIKLENRDLVFQYDREYGYAVLLITNQKDLIVNKAINSLMEKFNENNKELLKKIENASMLIDISQFKNAKELIYEYFKPYIRKKINLK